MINFSTNSSTFNPLVNLKVSVKNADSKGTNSSILNSSQNTNSTQNKNSNSNEILGYQVDKDGFFTAEFNEKAGIPQDYKIHSSTMQSLVKVATSGLSRSFDSIDIAKSVGNAYKILSQVVGESVLSSKDSFTKDEIAQFPQGYEFNVQTLQVSKIYDTKDKLNNAIQGYDYDRGHKNRESISGLFRYSPNSAPATNIFDNLSGGQESGVHWATTASKYTNADGSISKGGLLIGVLNANLYIKDGETTDWGKFQGFDKSLDYQGMIQAKGNGLFFFNGLTIDEASFAPSFWGADDEFSYKDPTQMILEEIIKMQKELAQKALKKRLDTATQASAQNSNFVKDKSQATSEILGYGVDNDGFFTSDFNETAGIAKDYKIYAKGAQNLVDYIFAHPNTHTSIDFAKSLGNVYKLFSQIAPSTENSNFTKEQISTLPVGFEYDTKSFKVIKTYNYEQMQGLQDYAGAKNAQFAQIFPSQAGTNAHLQGKPSEDIFQSNPYIDIGTNAYKNADGSVDKGGVLMAFFSARIGQFEGSFLVGETTIRGKLAGLDSNVSQEQIEDLDNFIKQNPMLYGSTDDLVARLRLKESNLSIDDFKTEWLKLKQKSDEIQAKMSGQTAQNSGVHSANKTSANSTASENTNATENSQNEQSTAKTSSSIQAKSDIFKDMDLSRLQSILKNQHKFDLISILFGTNSSASFGGANGNDLNTILMNLNLSKIKPLNKVDIKA